MTKSSKQSKLRAALSDTLAPRAPASPEKLSEILSKHANPASSPPVSPTTQSTVSQPTVSQLAPSQPTEPPLASPVSQPTMSQPDTGHLDLLKSAPDSAGYTKTPNRIYDHLCSVMTPDEQAVYFQLFRLSWGHNKDTCFISNARLSERSSVPLSTMKRVVAQLVGKGMIEKTGTTHGPKKEQGVNYRVPAVSQLGVSQPTTSQPTVAYNKEKNIKKDSKEVAAPPNFQNCPDCHGTGFHYVDELDRGKGVEKCVHRNLK